MTREEAIEVVRKNLPHLGIGATEMTDALGTLIPELKESEDERIRKELISQVEKSRHHPADKARWLAYLEKQKEQKPADCIEDSVKFEEGFKAGRESGLRDGQKYVLNNLDSYGLCKLAEWSEMDELMMKAVIGILDENDHPKLCSWLKSLRPSWKPSEEQMTMLRAVLNDPNNAGAESCQLALSGLYEQLKKL